MSPAVNGSAYLNGSAKANDSANMTDDVLNLTLQIRNRKDGDKQYAKFHGDHLIGDKIPQSVGLSGDLKAIFAARNWSALAGLIGNYIGTGGLDASGAAQIAGTLSDYSTLRQKFIDDQVKSKYDRMLHPPLTYLGDAFQYRTADGKFNSVINPHLGQAGAPYAKTVPSKTAPLGALPDPDDLFEKLMARKEGGRESTSGLSSMLIYHATIIIHDIFRTNEDDKNISDSSSYLDLSPLYGYTMDMQREVRDNKYKLGLLKPDAFAEDRLLRQPPGVCIMLVMYNRYHNYAAKQLRRINENGRFSVPKKYGGTKLASLAKNFYSQHETASNSEKFVKLCNAYEYAWKQHEAAGEGAQVPEDLRKYEEDLRALLDEWKITIDEQRKFEAGYDAAWTKLDDDLFNTARLITCGMYIQVSVHDYLRALMGFHQFNTNFTLDPRTDFDQRKTTRGIGNQVTVEFNLLYRFHCAISRKDEKYTEDFFKTSLGIEHPADTSLEEFLKIMGEAKARQKTQPKPKPCKVTFGIPGDKKQHFERNEITGLFDDDQMVNALTEAMDDPISNFGPRNVPRCLKAVEIMGITQARKWEIGTLNDFREFFGMHRHQTFDSITQNAEIQNALRDLYEHPDKVELYPGIFCESDAYMGLDPGPSGTSSALWTAIFCDAITLVRSDRFYTVDWNTNSLTSWGMNEVTPNNEICKSSVFHRLIQRAFPDWFQYDSVRFFHPFYTSDTNMKFAKAQGYGHEFKRFPEPFKPVKPVHLNDYDNISLVLRDTENTFVHPVMLYPQMLPKQLREVLEPSYRKSALNVVLGDQPLENESSLMKYVDELMKAIVKRESIAMTKSTFQIDATRDFAIPVVTRYVSDFLGFGHLLRTESNLNGSLEETDVYQHITNCQIFLSYNADETKMLKRRKAFVASIKVLIDLTINANIASANQWEITRALFGRKRANNPMGDLGFSIAQKVLDHERDTGKAAAILVLICLDFAYNSVVSFTAVLDSFMKELYETADYIEHSDSKTNLQIKPKWIIVQELAFSEEKADRERIAKLVQYVARKTVRLPILRVARKEYTAQPKTGASWCAQKDQTIILNIQEATEKAEAESRNLEMEFLDSQANLAGKFGAYDQPRRLATLALTSMVRFVARMKNARRGHDAQGQLKRIHLDWTAEGYSNFMAPMRIQRIRKQVEALPASDANKNIFTDKILRPATDTYLTPSWDEMVPFPMTWKIRFDGFGKSDYSSDTQNPYGRLKTRRLPDDAPPWYQPQGLSHVGGSFAETVCICATPGMRCACLKEGASGTNGTLDISLENPAASEPTLSTGCGLHA